jgi:hypothetical protein
LKIPYWVKGRDRRQVKEDPMKTATGLTVTALGAVFAFAVHGHPWFLNLQVVGWILMILGIVGILLPRRGYGWLRRQMVIRRDATGRPVMWTRQKRYPPYMMINPAPAPEPDAGPDAFETAEIPPAAEPERPASSEAQSREGTRVTRTAGPEEEEVIEEYFPE